MCQPVQMTCRTEELPVLMWYNGSMAIAAYTFISRHTFPRIIFAEGRVTVEVTDAIREEEISDNFNAVSVMTTTTLALRTLYIMSIQCGFGPHRSSSIDLSIPDDIRGKHCSYLRARA